MLKPCEQIIFFQMNLNLSNFYLTLLKNIILFYLSKSSNEVVKKGDSMGNVSTRFVFLNLIFCLCGILQAADIAVVTMAIGDAYEKQVAAGIENKRLYCEKYGYDFINSNEWLDLSRPIPWSKIKLLQETLKQNNYKWVFWTDADALFMNHGVRLEDIIDDKYDFMITYDMHSFNSGNFLLKNSEWSKQFLEKIYSYTECIHHPWWENQAIVLELQNNEEVQKKTKIFPQRIMNSYARELMSRISLENSISVNYQPGDFIVHFPACPRDELSTFMNHYAANTIDNPNFADLDTYLGIYGLQLSPGHSHINEGYCTESQKRMFIQDLQGYKNIKKIAEIGFNAGHSAQIFFENCPNSQVLSFDLNHYHYTKIGVEFMQRKYKDNFKFVEGNSQDTVPNYTLNHPHDKYDLLYIDGDHSYLGFYTDLVNCQKLATKDTIVWVDDCVDDVQQALNLCVEQGLMSITKYNSDWTDSCGARVWAEARYLFPSAN